MQESTRHHIPGMRHQWRLDRMKLSLDACRSKLVEESQQRDDGFPLNGAVTGHAYIDTRFFHYTFLLLL